MAPASNHIQCTYVVRDTNAVPNTNDAMIFLVQPIHQFHTVSLTNEQGRTQPLHINGAKIVQHASPSQNERGSQPLQHLQSNGDRMVQHVSRRPRAKRFALTFDIVSQKFYMPITKAAKEFNLSTNTLKLRCRELGFEKWPFPKLNSLRNLVKNVMEVRFPGFQNVVEKIKDEMESIKQNPSLDIKDETLILRQRMYELKKKRRRRIDASVA